MRIVAFFSRFALICNIAFILCLLVQRTYDFIGSPDINSAIIILGWIVAPLANLLVCVIYLSRLLTKRTMGVRVWLALTNLIFLIVQIFVHLIIPQ